MKIAKFIINVIIKITKEKDNVFHIIIVEILLKIIIVKMAK